MSSKCLRQGLRDAPLPFCDHDNLPGAQSCENCRAIRAWSTEPQSTRCRRTTWISRLRDLLAVGRRIEAIKLYREATGVGLKEAKDAVEVFEQGKTVGLPGGVEGSLEAELVALLGKGRKIEAIKRYREATGAGSRKPRMPWRPWHNSMACRRTRR